MLELLKSLTRDELAIFRKFVHSQYLNTNNHVAEFVDYYFLKLRSKCVELYEKEFIFGKVFPGEKYDDSKYRKFASDFTEVFERFLVQTEFDSDLIGKNVMLLKNLRLRGLKKRFEIIYRQTIKLQNMRFSKDETFYRNQEDLLSEFYAFNYDFPEEENSQSLQEKSDNIDLGFVFSKLHCFNEMLDNNNRLNHPTKFKMEFYEEVINYISQNISLIKQKHPNIYIIYLRVMMVKTMNDEYLSELMKFLELKRKKFTNEKMCYYYNYVVSYLWLKINSGQTRYREDLFELYNMMLEKDLFLIDNSISEIEFTSVVNAVLPLRKFEWIDKFIEKYKSHLDSRTGDDAYSLARAKLLFHMKDFEGMFRYLGAVEIKSPGYYFNSKALLARTYFDTGDITAVRYISDNLKQYVRTNKEINRTQLSQIASFNKYLMALIKLRESANESYDGKIIVLKKQLDHEEDYVPNKAWFYEKLEEMLNK